jgi:cysteine desulfurase/selenocysteine lyase
MMREGIFSTQSGISYDIHRIREDFPIFGKPINGRSLIYLDNASTTQKPQTVLKALNHFYTQECATVHRGVYYLAEKATESYEFSREKLRRFINASSVQELVFVRGATEAINLVAQTFGQTKVSEGDELLISTMEHHSNIVPWQMLCEQKGARLRIIPLNSQGELVFELYEQMLNSKTRLVALTYVSNALGTINPMQKIIQLAHSQNIPVLVDAAQAVPHFPIDVQLLDCDFLVASGHKMYGPMGIGFLYGKASLLDAMPPYQGGGDMISSVSFKKTLFSPLPNKFEAGTPNVAGAIGLGAAVDYLNHWGMQSIRDYEKNLSAFATAKLEALDYVQIIGTPKDRAGVFSFIMPGIHPHDIACILDSVGIAIRAGHHCAQPLMDFYKIPATSRISLGLYNTYDDIEAFLKGLEKVREVFR